MADGIFPRRDDERNTYYNSAIPYIDTNKARLGVSGSNDTDIVNLQTEWNSVYPSAKNPDKRTKTVTDKKDQLIVRIESLLRDIYADIPESALTDADRNTLNLKKRDTIPTGRPKIDVTPVVKVNSLNGALIEFICRADSDSTRASKLKEADGIELAYDIGGSQPVSPSECTKSFFSTKAKFKINLDVANAGKKAFVFARWKNNSDPAKSGPWSKIISTSISD